ncbi:uncharacterized protein isoform X4 [Takifugu rubripes]|uniref:uncharacterized protein isoform X4 n=1 Tax=Takifugu rubripes TaxID=31033 RepID=UPI0011456DEB|nr:uncharacterized protein LOC115248906 isoform X4 [Takifugu rubripes]
MDEEVDISNKQASTVEVMLFGVAKRSTETEEDNCLNDSSSVPGPSKLPATLTWKKCSNEGRALMQLDFQQFLMKLEKLTDLRPIPDKEFVETYIKAYYLTENENSPRELDLPIPALMIMLQELF